jgi:hypothetical protein
MPTTNGNKKILDMKRWEFCTPAAATATSGACISSSWHFKQNQLYLASATLAYLYNPNEDGFVQIPSPGLSGTFGAGACIVAAAWSTGTTTAVTSLTATAGTTTSITTNQTLARDLRGYAVHILSGPNAGVTATIARNTIGANSVITFSTTYGTAFDATTTYRLITPRWYVLNAGALATGIFRVYDYATNTWTSLGTTNLPATVGTDSRLVSTPSWINTEYVEFAIGTATSATSSTLVNSAKNWALNQWANSQVRIVSGTGAGQIRIVTSNTATTLTVPTWTVTPDATSEYVIEGNDDYLYYMGSASVNLIRYSISSNTWTLLAPAVARAGVAGSGVAAHWIYGVTDSTWNIEDTIENGRYIYSFRGSASTALDRYDIAGNTWSVITYAPATETFFIGTKFAYNTDYIYIHKDATGRWFRYNLITSDMDGWNTMLYPNSTAVVGDTAFDVTYTDGATKIVYIYMILNNSSVMLRQMVV